jgi:hypothetical protein
MKGIKHHLLGYLDSTSISNLIVDFKAKAVELVSSNFPEFFCLVFEFLPRFEPITKIEAIEMFSELETGT